MSDEEASVSDGDMTLHRSRKSRRGVVVIGVVCVLLVIAWLAWPGRPNSRAFDVLSPSVQLGGAPAAGLVLRSPPPGTSPRIDAQHAYSIARTEWAPRVTAVLQLGLLAGSTASGDRSQLVWVVRYRLPGSQCPAPEDGAVPNYRVGMACNTWQVVNASTGGMSGGVEWTW